MSSIALVDCNNFFVSCERIFDPLLRKKPVVVLSCNDGCIIARSNEAKALGIPMGAPFFEWKDFMEKRGVVVRSSNFALYGDISSRVMQTLAHFYADIEIYSVDEAFLFIENGNIADLQDLRDTILKWIGIPVSIGLSSTKTLAKLAAKRAKQAAHGVFPLLDEKLREEILFSLPVKDVWGIGSKIASSLAKKGVRTAFAFKNKDDLWIKRNFSVQTVRTAWELRGIPCFLQEEEAPKQSMMTSRSFGQPIFEKEALAQALSYFAVRGGEKLREEGSLAHFIEVFIMTSLHNDEIYADQVHITFPEPTDYTPHFIDAVKKGLNRLFRPNLPFKRGGILLGGLVPKHCFQGDLFAKNAKRKQQEDVMELIDTANAKFGYDIMQFGAACLKTVWQGKSKCQAPSYTTNWNEILTVDL